MRFVAKTEQAESASLVFCFSILHHSNMNTTLLMCVCFFLDCMFIVQ